MILTLVVYGALCLFSSGGGEGGTLPLVYMLLMKIGKVSHVTSLREAQSNLVPSPAYFVYRS